MTNVNEIIWKDVPNFEGYYQVSDTGLIRRYGNLNTLKPSIVRYSRVTLCVNSSLYYFQVHRVVAIVFVPNPHNLPMVNHKDTNKLNNNASNLEWTDHIGNMKHGVENKLFASGERNAKSILSDLDVVRIRTEFIDTPNSVLAKQFGVSYCNIWDIKRGRSRQ